MWNLDTNSAFALELKKPTENLDRVDPSQDLSGCKLTSSQQSGIKYAKPIVIPYLSAALFGKKVALVGWANFFWVSPAQSFLVPSPARLMSMFSCATTVEVVQLTQKNIAR
jgi:hypothetical protein